jgi:hypothetical protein
MLQRSGMGVTEAVEFASLGRANEAEAGLPLADVAVARAEVAVHFATGFKFPPASFVKCIGLLQDSEILHFKNSF